VTNPNTVPEKRMNKDGVLVTKHVNPDKGKTSAAASKKVASAATPPASAAAPEYDYTDPFGNMPFPSKHPELFENAQTFADIDAVYMSNFDKAEEDPYGYRWAAIERGRQLRREGTVPLVPAKKIEGLFGSHYGNFGLAQNLVEIEEMYALITEEPPGDGEIPMSQVRQIFRGYQKEAKERLAQLHDAGVVPKNITLNFN